MTPEQLFILNTRRSFYPHPILGRWFENKLSWALNQLQQNFFEALDINRYFFASHPRERGGVNEFALVPFWLLPLFVLGLVELGRNKRLLLLYAFVLPVVTGLGPRHDTVISLMVIPVLGTIILGCKRLWRRWR